MPSKKKKYNARFPPARIKKIMQSDEEVGKVAQAVPVIISRALELFVESLLKKAETVTQARNAKTLTPSHLKQCIMSEGRFDFLRELVSTIPDVQGEEELAETPTPTPRNSSQAFSYPVPSQGQGHSRSSTIVAAPSAAVGSSQQQQAIDHSDDNQAHRQEPIAEYAQGLPYSPEQKSVIVSPQQHSYVLNPAGVTSNPYIPISSAAVGVFPVYAHPQPQLGQTPNPNGTTSQSYPDKNIYN